MLKATRTAPGFRSALAWRTAEGADPCTESSLARHHGTHREMQIRSTRDYNFTPSRMAGVRNWTTASAGQDVELQDGAAALEESGSPLKRQHSVTV